MSRFVRALALAVTLALGSVALTALPAQAATTTYSVKATLKSSAGKTILWLSKTGRVVATKAITKSNQAVTLSTTSKKISKTMLNGSTLQLVTTSGGDYYGPVVLGWSSKTKVYTQMNFGSANSINFGTINKKAVTTNQGYALASAKSGKVLTKVVKAVNYKPVGVGTYGKVQTGAATVSFSTASLASGAAGDIDLNASISTFATDPQANNYTGADPDADGLPNFADVNDDGDTRTDAADSTTPAPPQSVGGTNCEAGASFTIFTNFKSTAMNFAGNLNYYGPGDFQANTSRINNALTNTLSMVIQPIRQVCGSNVTKTEFKGVGVPYAPTDFVDITGKTAGSNDYQWTIGNGRMSGQTVTGLSAYTFSDPTQISGQDTFIQRVTTAAGNVYEYSATAGFVFVTHPLPLKYSADNSTWSDFIDTSGAVVYPGNRVSTTGHVYIKMLRPQRLAVEGESTFGTAAPFVDLGGMKYTPDIPNPMNGTNVGKCDSQTSTDSSFVDTPVTSGDAPVYTIDWNLGSCLTSRGGTWSGSGWNFDVDVQVEPSGRGGNSAQKIGFTAQ